MGRSSELCLGHGPFGAVSTRGENEPTETLILKPKRESKACRTKPDCARTNY